MAAAISNDLGRAHGTAPDAQIVNGAGSGQNMRGLLNVAGILTVTGTVTTARPSWSRSGRRTRPFQAGTGTEARTSTSTWLSPTPAVSPGCAGTRPGLRRRRSFLGQWSPPQVFPPTRALARTKTSRSSATLGGHPRRRLAHLPLLRGGWLRDADGADLDLEPGRPRRQAPGRSRQGHRPDGAYRVLDA